MYCSNCGVKASGNFCSSCGSPLAATAAVATVPVLEPAVPDWQDETRYSVLLHFPEVRDLIARHASHARKGISGERLLELYDKVMTPLTHVSLSTVASIAAPIYARMGIQTGKNRSAQLAEPPGKVLVAAVCSLARHGRELQQVHQAGDGCILEARLPSDLWSFAGEVVVTVNRHATGTQVEAVTKIPGQWYDWGKSNRCLNELFADLVRC